MQRPPFDISARRRFFTSRRRFLKSGLMLAGSLPFSTGLTGCWDDRDHRDHPPNPRYILRREVDELFLELEAFGYRETAFLGSRYLERVKEYRLPPQLVFTFPPQHFAETAIGVKSLPATLPEKVLSTISLFPSRPSKLIFRVSDRDRLKLTLDDLLDWQNFELILPNLDGVGGNLPERSIL